MPVRRAKPYDPDHHRRNFRRGMALAFQQNGRPEEHGPAACKPYRVGTLHFSDIQERFNRVTAEWVANDSRIVPGDHSGFFTRYESAKESIAAAEDALSSEDTSTYEGITRVEDRVSHANEEIARLENEWSHVAFLNPAAL